MPPLALAEALAEPVVWRIAVAIYQFWLPMNLAVNLAINLAGGSPNARSSSEALGKVFLSSKNL